MAFCPGWAYGPNFFLCRMAFMSRLDVERFERNDLDLKLLNLLKKQVR